MTFVQKTANGQAQRHVDANAAAAKVAPVLRTNHSECRSDLFQSGYFRHCNSSGGPRPGERRFDHMQYERYRRRSTIPLLSLAYQRDLTRGRLALQLK